MEISTAVQIGQAVRIMLIKIEPTLGEAILKEETITWNQHTLNKKAPIGGILRTPGTNIEKDLLKNLNKSWNVWKKKIRNLDKST